MQKKALKQLFSLEFFTNQVNFLFLIQIFSVITFSIMSYSLGTILNVSIHATEYLATQITSTYIALNFVLHLIASIMLKHVANARSLLLISIILSILGCLIMSLKMTPIFFSYGLAMQLCGNGLSITCINSIINKKSKNTNKAQFFLFNYSAMNIGFLIGFLISGYYSFKINYHELFLACVLFNSIAYAIASLLNKEKANINFRLFFIPIILIILTQFFLIKSYFSNQFLLVALFFTLFYILYKNKIHISNNNIQKFILLIISGLVFWSIYYLTPIALMFFIKNYVNNTVLNINIAPQWYEILNSIIIIFGTIIFANHLLKKSNKYNFQKLFYIAIGLSSLGIFLLLIGIYITPINSKISSIWIIIKIILESIGELILAPIGMVLAISFLPKKEDNIAIGVWLMLNGAAASISGLLIKTTSYSNTLLNLNTFSLSHYNRILFLTLTIGITCCFTLFITNLKINNKFKSKL